MKKIEAIIHTSKFQDIHYSLRNAGFEGFLVTEVKSYEQSDKKGFYRAVEYKIKFNPMLKLEIVCTDENCKSIKEILMDECRTTDICNSRILVLPVEESIRIKTKEIDIYSVEEGLLS